MSLREQLKTLFARALTSPRVRDLRRRAHETARTLRNRPHVVTWFHRADDPWSFLLAQALPRFLQRYPVQLRCRTIGEPVAAVEPEPMLRARYALVDARRMAPLYDLEMPDDPVRPDAGDVAAVKARLVEVESSPLHYVDVALELGRRLFAGETVAASQSVASVAGRLTRNERALRWLGHYSSGALHYAGEWYVGVDRLQHLERRLCELGVGRGHALELTPPPRPPTFESGVAGSGSSSIDVEMFFSVRSPYSYLAFERAHELAERWGITLTLRPVLPMVQRGMQVPLTKRIYIVEDANREANRLGIPFGNIADPLPGVTAVLALWHQADRRGVGRELLQLCMRGAWSEGMDLADDAVLESYAAAVGLERDLVDAARRDESWRERVDANREALFAHGLWGVPSFVMDDFATWGQDRLVLLEHTIAERMSERSTDDPSDRSPEDVSSPPSGPAPETP